MADEEVEVETKRCSNCKKDIPSANFIMHQTHCQRNIVLCKHCKEPVPRSEMDSHIDELHVQVTCKCGDIMEKRLLEDHEASECSKREVICEYCELEMTFGELSEHQNFCGSRTEPCLKCNRYIMLKDLKKHEDSMCTYPEIKESPPKNISRGRDYYPEEFSMDIGPYGMFSPYTEPSMHSQLRTKPKESKPSNIRSQIATTSRTGRTTRKLDTMTTSSPNNLKKTVPRKTVSVPRTQNRTRGNETQSRSSHSQSYSQRPKNQPGVPMSSHGHEDMDRLLAMHLAHDLTTAEDIDSFIESANQIPDPPPPSTFQSRLYSRGPPSPSRDEPESPLPCEFCGDLFPQEMLAMHQSSCESVPGMEPIENSPPNNSIPMFPGSRSQPLHPEIVDNLGYGSSPPRDQPPSQDIEEDTDGLIFLPCEFCEVLLPEDSLVQHQAMCEADRSKTPWPVAVDDDSPSPMSSPEVIRQPAPRPRPKQRKPPANAGYGNPTRSTRHQGDPGFDFRRADDPRSVPIKKMNPLPASTYGGRSSMPIRSRPKKTTGTSHSMAKPRIKSAERTKKTLDDLLADRNIDTDEILQHMGSSSRYFDEDQSDSRVDNGWGRQGQDPTRYDLPQDVGEPSLDEFDIFLPSHQSRDSRYGNPQSRRVYHDDEEDAMPMGYEASFSPPPPPAAAVPRPANRSRKGSHPHTRTPKSKSTSLQGSSVDVDFGVTGTSPSSRPTGRSSHPGGVRGAVPKQTRKPPSNRRRFGDDV
ncbi:TRAF-type zinc finger domain-containing protein 1-like [Glandiceps talaboti]